MPSVGGPTECTTRHLPNDPLRWGRRFERGGGGRRGRRRGDRRRCGSRGRFILCELGFEPLMGCKRGKGRIYFSFFFWIFERRKKKKKKKSKKTN